MKAPSKSRQLRCQLQLVDRGLRTAMGALWNHPQLAQLYPTAMLSAFTVMRATVPVMERARDRAAERAGTSELCAALARYLDKHAAEERGHDQWALDDLEALGLDRAEAAGCLPSPTAAALVGAQYFWIDHVHPVAIMGYIAVIEGDPPIESDIEQVIERTGLPAAAFTNLLRHARLDPLHCQEFDAALDAMPMSEREWDLVGVSAIQSASLYEQLVEEIIRFGVAGPASLLTGRSANSERSVN